MSGDEIAGIVVREQSREPVAYRLFRSRIESWEALFGNAAGFATEVGRERVISISHSSDGGDGVVVVWYWG